MDRGNDGYICYVMKRLIVQSLTREIAPDLTMALDCEARGIPIGRPAEVNLRNNHTQYVFTW